MASESAKSRKNLRTGGGDFDIGSCLNVLSVPGDRVVEGKFKEA